MKIGFLSDAHGNPSGLAACLRCLKTFVGVEKLYFLGDAVGYMPGYAEVLEQLRQVQAECVLGNHDAMLLGDLALDPARDEVYRIGRNKKLLSGGDLADIKSWPREKRIVVNGKRMHLVHGSPWEPLTGYVYPDSDLTGFSSLEAEIVVMGHSHYPLVRKVGRTLLINPGSCGLPRDHGRFASCAVYDTATGSATILRMPLDVDAIRKRFGDTIHPSVYESLARPPAGALVGEVMGSD